MPATKPWSDLIPKEDVSSFRRGFDPEIRPVSAGTRPAIIVVDMTREFVDDAYPSGWGETGWPAVAANARLLEGARAAGLPIFFTKGYEDPSLKGNPAEHGRWKTNGPRPELPPGTPYGDVIVDELTPLEDEIVVHKAGRPSGFNGTRLTSLMIHAGADTAIVTGMTTSGCVRATVLDAFMNNFSVIVPFECAADRSQISHKVNLFDMHMKYADVISLEETLGYIVKLPSLQKV
jgi:nicotinamidase-related amidase